MSTDKVYRFSQAAHWDHCLLHGFEPDGDGLKPLPPLGPHAGRVGPKAALATIAADPYGTPYWTFGADCPEGEAGALGGLDEGGAVHGPTVIDDIVAHSPRLVADRQWLWAFGHDGITRYDRRGLQPDRGIGLAELGDEDESPVQAVRDICSDGRDGLWILAARAGGEQVLLRFGCDDGVVARHGAPEADGPWGQIGVLGRGARLVLPSEDGATLCFVDAGDGAPGRVLPISQFAPGWRAERLGTDGRGRIGLGLVDADGNWRLQLLDAQGEPLHAPFDDLFDGAAVRIADLALGRDSVWLATDAGAWRLAGEAQVDAAASSAILVTPRLMSPKGADRGWSRAELELLLPRGAALEVSFGSTDDKNLADAVGDIARNDALTRAARQEHMWFLLQHGGTVRSFGIEGPADPAEPVAIPLYSTTDQWLWLRLRLELPALVGASRLGELRVLYPERTLMSRLPRMFSTPEFDPGGDLRNLVGAIETTTQGIDRAIAGIGRQLDAGSAPADWLDYLGRWLDLPWHEALPEASKRALLGRAGALTTGRGTRQGLLALLQCLVGEPAIIRIEDVTVEHQALRLGGDGQPGVPMPALLAGNPQAPHMLGRKARLGRARLGCAPTADPLASIAPTLRIGLVVPPRVKQALAPLLPAILEQFVPFGVRLSVRWQARPAAGIETGDAILALDDTARGELGETAVVGQTLLAGRRGKITSSGFEMGLRLL